MAGSAGSTTESIANSHCKFLTETSFLYEYRSSVVERYWS